MTNVDFNSRSENKNVGSVHAFNRRGGYQIDLLGRKITLPVGVAYRLITRLFFLPPDKLRLLPCEMQTTLNYYKRLARNQPPPVESECSNVSEARFVSPHENDKRRFYVGTGHEIYEIHVWSAPWDSDNPKAPKSVSQLPS